MEQKYINTLNQIPELREKHEKMLSDAHKLRHTFEIKSTKYTLHQLGNNRYSLSDNSTNKYLIAKVTPGEIKRYVRSNDIDQQEICDADIIFDHISLEKYEKFDKYIELIEGAIDNINKIERSIQYKHSDYLLLEEKVPNVNRYKLYNNGDKTLFFEGTRKEMIDVVEEGEIDPLPLFKVELSKYIF